MTAAKEDIAGINEERKRATKAASAVVDDRPLVQRLYSLWHELRAAGWLDMASAPKDGAEIELIEMGSSGIFKASWHSYRHDPFNNCGCFFGEDGDATYPMRGVMWRPIKSRPAT